jgi:hypothetical protein
MGWMHLGGSWEGAMEGDMLVVAAIGVLLIYERGGSWLMGVNPAI